MTDTLYNTLHCKKIQSLSWQDVREPFTEVNSKLASIVDAIDPGKNLPILKITYAFGDKIIENGRLCILENFKNNPTLAQNLKLPNILEQLSYSPIPLGLFLNKKCETFIETQDRIIPTFVLHAGRTIGLFETLDVICGVQSMPMWNVTAGARSLFMLSKINNNLWHKRLTRHFNITVPTPTNLNDHWQVFNAIANAHNSHSNWYCDMLFFPKCWITHLNDKSIGWSQLREYLFKECWLMASPMIEKSFSFIWQHFSLSTIRRNYKPRIYITDTIRHLMSIVANLAPAFIPANNEESAPIQLIKTAYHNIYNLPYAPTIMEPAFISSGNSHVYYSLGYPTLLEGHPEVSNIYNTISDLKEIKLLIENMHRYCQQSTGDAQKFLPILEKVKLAYFHKAHDNQNEILAATQLPAVDTNFCETTQTFSPKEFCSTSPFLNGCIQIKNTFLG